MSQMAPGEQPAREREDEPRAQGVARPEQEESEPFPRRLRFPSSPCFVAMWMSMALPAW